MVATYFYLKLRINKNIMVSEGIKGFSEQY